MSLGEIELLIGEQRREMFKRYAIAYELRRTTIDLIDRDKRVIVFTDTRWTNCSFDDITLFEVVLLDLLLADENIVGGREVVVVAGAVSVTS